MASLRHAGGHAAAKEFSFGAPIACRRRKFGDGRRIPSEREETSADRDGNAGSVYTAQLEMIEETLDRLHFCC
jgi:hypothetical protein